MPVRRPIEAIDVCKRCLAKTLWKTLFMTHWDPDINPSDVLNGYLSPSIVCTYTFVIHVICVMPARECTLR
eukprot:scaffold38589_cov41-Cyclotella_meneghiniana.AAC.4